MAVFFFFFLRCCKYVVGQLWHSSIWNFLMKNKEKNQAHEELIMIHINMPTIIFLPGITWREIKAYHRRGPIIFSQAKHMRDSGLALLFLIGVIFDIAHYQYELVRDRSQTLVKGAYAKQKYHEIFLYPPFRPLKLSGPPLCHENYESTP